MMGIDWVTPVMWTWAWNDDPTRRLAFKITWAIERRPVVGAYLCFAAARLSRWT